MALSRSTLQNHVRFYSDNSNDTLSSGDGQVAFDTAYLGMFNPHFTVRGIRIGRKWPERTREDTSLTMTAGTATYTWPTDPPIKEPFFIEGLDVNASNEPYPIPLAPDMETWSAVDDSNNARPVFYRIRDVAGVLTLELRPAPDQADPIRITSLQGVSRFPATASTTTDASSASGQAVVNVTATTMFSAGDHVIIAEGTSNEERGIVLSVSAGATITLTANLSNTHASGVTVERTTIFADEEMDFALAKVVAAILKAKRGDPDRATELMMDARGHLPMYDRTPRLQAGGHLQPWCV